MGEGNVDGFAGRLIGAAVCAERHDYIAFSDEGFGIYEEFRGCERFRGVAAKAAGRAGDKEDFRHGLAFLKRL